MQASDVKLTPEPIANLSAWTDEFTNVISHIIQINQRLFDSSWGKEYSIIGYSQEPLPDIDAATLPLVLLRQVIGRRDQLMGRVKCAYEACLPESTHTAFIRHHTQELEVLLSSILPITKEEMREFYEAIIYGSGLFHTPDCDHDNFQKQSALLDRLHKSFSKSDILEDLKYTIDIVWHHVSEVATLCNIDFIQWKMDGHCKPTLITLDKLFRIPDSIEAAVEAFLKQHDLA